VGLDQLSWHDDLTALRLLNATWDREVPLGGLAMMLGKPIGARYEISIDLEQAPKYLIRDNCNRQCIQIPDPSRVGHVVWNEQTVSYLSSTFVTMRHEVKKVRLSVSIPDALPVSTSMTGIPCSR
jgi:hypothetical protein